MDASRGGAFHTDADFEAGRVHTVHHALRRGKIITDEELAVDEADEGGAGTSGGIGSGGDSEESDNEGEDAEVAAARREIKWSLPLGLKVAVKPASLDVSLIGAKIFMRW